MQLLRQIAITSLACLLWVGSADPSAAERPTCRYGAASDGQTYRLCETRDEVRLQRGLGVPAPFDPFIDALVEAERQTQSPAPGITGAYLGIGAAVGVSRRFDPGLEIAVGGRISDALRSEISLALGHRKHDRFADAFGEGARTSILPILASAGLDVFSTGRVSAFVTGGLGASHVEVVRHGGAAGGTEKQHAFVFTAAAGGGISYEISPGVFMDLGYRYLHLAGGPSGAARSAHDVKITFRLPIFE